MRRDDWDVAMSNSRVTDDQSRAAALAATRWCLKQAGLRPGESVDALPPELRAMAGDDLRGLLALLLEDPSAARRVA